MNEPKYKPGEVLRHKASGELVVVVGSGYYEKGGEGGGPWWEYVLDLAVDEMRMTKTHESRLDVCFERVNALKSDNVPSTVTG